MLPLPLGLNPGMDEIIIVLSRPIRLFYLCTHGEKNK